MITFTWLVVVLIGVLLYSGMLLSLVNERYGYLYRYMASISQYIYIYSYITVYIAIWLRVKVN